MSCEASHHNKTQLPSEIAVQIALALQDIRFGSVEIIIHEGKVVQIERNEKLRFNAK
ncbi:MAG: YezD family protein [Methyloprofundus sp.]|nr:YezD family protein [Methyloprofundus sp.]MDT8426646.1 YezD family protein [Methyloprofundus sp.]